MISALGHCFNEDLLCRSCKVDYYEHQKRAEPCPHPVTQGCRGRPKTVTWLVRFAKAHKINFEELSEASGIPWRKLREVSTGRTLGPKRRLVWRTLIALARAKG